MTKRKLNRRQAWRVEKIQEDRLQRAHRKNPVLAPAEILPGGLGPETSGTVVAHYGASLEVEDDQGQVFRCLMRQNLPELVCGDRVIWQPGGDHNGIVTALVPRRSLLVRPGYAEQLKLVAANIDQIMVVAAPQPLLDIDLINRYLVAAELTHIRPVLVINKIDLLDAPGLAALQQSLAVYRTIGYELLYASSKRQHGLDALAAQLKDQTSIFAGQSGVGKSSLILALLPGAQIRVGEVSVSSGLGRHTTTTTVLYHLPQGGNLIDSPGVREFGLGHIPPTDLPHGFVEFHAHLGRCKFNDCEHTVEPGCAIRAAVDVGEISAERYASYRRILASLED